MNILKYIFKGSRVHILNVDLEREGQSRDEALKLPGFSRHLFQRHDWEILKAFCLRFNIRQAELVVVFQKFLQHEEVYLNKFQIRTLDIKKKFLFHSKLHQEMADVFIPAIYLGDLYALDRPETALEISFTRFVIASFVFCSQQIPDLIYNFLAVLRQKLDLPLTAKVFVFSIRELITVAMEDLEPSAGKTLLQRCLKYGKEDAELVLLQVVKLGLKYPLLFYVVERFRKHMKRVVFGDKFWSTRHYLKSKVPGLEVKDYQWNINFEDEEAATCATARSIISDVVYTNVTGQYTLTETLHPKLESITEDQCKRLKNVFGYKISAQLILESELKQELKGHFLKNITIASDLVNMNTEFINVHKKGYASIMPSDVIQMFDEGAGRKFKVNIVSGKKEWARVIVDEEGDIVEEQFPKPVRRARSPS